MKKYICLLLIVILSLTLCVPAFARYEGCPSCETRLVTRIADGAKAVKCDIIPSEYDIWYYEYLVEYCPNCGEEQSRTLISKRFECGHRANVG